MKRKPKSALTPKRRDFVDRFIAGGMKDRIAAYRAAFKSKGNDATCHKEATRLLAVPAIAELVQEAERRAEAATERVIIDYAVSRERVLEGLAQIAFFDPRSEAELQRLGAVSVEQRRLALMDVAKLEGFVVDKAEFKGDVTNKVISAEPLTDAEWERKYGSNGKA